MATETITITRCDMCNKVVEDPAKMWGFSLPESDTKESLESSLSPDPSHFHGAKRKYDLCQSCCAKIYALVKRTQNSDHLPTKKGVPSFKDAIDNDMTLGEYVSAVCRANIPDWPDIDGM